MTRACIDCCGPISARNRSGRCKSCNLKWVQSSPEIEQRRVAAVRASMERPEWKAKQRAALSHYHKRKIATDPVYRQMMVERGRRVHGDGIGNRIRPAGSEARARAGQKITDAKLAWCPPDKRDQYRQLVYNRHFRASEAKAIILDQIKVDQERFHNRLSPFERQEMALQKGAGLTEGYSKVTLGGVRRA